MSHLIQNKKKLLARISRIRGQINGIEKALIEERECGDVLLTLAAQNVIREVRAHYADLRSWQSLDVSFQIIWRRFFHDIWRIGAGTAQSFAARSEPARIVTPYFHE